MRVPVTDLARRTITAPARTAAAAAPAPRPIATSRRIEPDTSPPEARQGVLTCLLAYASIFFPASVLFPASLGSGPKSPEPVVGRKTGGWYSDPGSYGIESYSRRFRLSRGTDSLRA